MMINFRILVVQLADGSIFKIPIPSKINPNNPQHEVKNVEISQIISIDMDDLDPVQKNNLKTRSFVELIFDCLSGVRARSGSYLLETRNDRA